MKLIIFAFILSLTIHILLFSPLTQKKEELKQNPSTSKYVKKSSVQYVRLQPKIIPSPNIIKKVEIVKPIQKKIIPKKKLKTYKKVEKKNIKPQKRKKIVKKPKIIIPKPIKKVETRPSFTKQVPIKPQKKRQTIPKKSLENFLLADPVPLDRRLLDDITKSYLKLYGEEYNSFTKVQKVYLQKNLKNIGRITERYLKYPAIAVRTRQHGMNIVQFNLHPNGNISDLRLSHSSGHSSLDKNTIETIEYAYKDYPRPKTVTKIKIYVSYNLY
ncbi:TonB family protein [Arcobacter sp. LA11]|uniref:TonB family protein n=1 Tax=Arcobacter sp. LA11 TaxID=1898176 RepID=UPI000934FB25|nr:TonB family protein [Arcobacter sp. LA11]